MKVPFLIHLNDLETDYLYPNLNDCPILEDMRKVMKKKYNFYKTSELYLECLSLAKEMLNIDDDPDNPLMFNEFLDDIHSRKVSIVFILFLLNIVISRPEKWRIYRVSFRFEMFPSAFRPKCPWSTISVRNRPWSPWTIWDGTVTEMFQNWKNRKLWLLLNCDNYP